MNNDKDILTSLTDNESTLRAYLFKKVGCNDVAQDIFQKLAEKFLTRKISLPLTNHLRYLYKAASNEAVSHYRFEEKRLQYESDYAQVMGEIDYRNAERATIANHDLKQLSNALGQLPAITRKIFIMYRIHGMKQTMIAKKLDLNLSTVEKRLAIAVKHCLTSVHDKKDYGKPLPQTLTKKESRFS